MQTKRRFRQTNSTPDSGTIDTNDMRDPGVEPDLPPLRFNPHSVGRFSPGDEELDDDTPVIRRIAPERPAMRAHRHTREPELCTPRLFAAQMPVGLPGDADNHVATVRAHPAERAPEWYDSRNSGWSGSDNVDFSVAAIRAKRMRTPAGTHSPTSMATKVTVMSLASVCLIAAGVSLGLYGGDLRPQVEDKLAAAGNAIQQAYNRLASAAHDGLEPGTATAQASMTGGSAAAALPGGPDATQAAPAGSGRKLIYMRLPVENADATDALAPPAEPSQTAQAATPLEALLATPVDFNALPTIKVD